MKARLFDLTRSVSAVREAARAEGRSALASMTLGLLLRAMEPYLQQYEQERQRLLEKYAVQANPQGMWKFENGEKRKAFDAEERALLDLDVDLAGVSPVPASKWAENGIQWSGEQLLVLQWLVPIDLPTLFEAPGISGEKGAEP